jgi:hypothetical protein
MYVVMKNGRGVEDLTSTGELPEGTEVEEMVAAGEGAGERTFLVRRALKRD